MTKYELVQQIEKLIDDYNQTHDNLLYIDWSNGFYYVAHPDIPELKYDLGYFNQDGDDYIQIVFKTLTQLIAIYKTLTDDFHTHRLHFYDNYITFFDDKNKQETLLKPLSDQMIMVKQTYRPSITELSFQKDDVTIRLKSDSSRHSIDAFYTASAMVDLDSINDTIEALKEKTQNTSSIL